MIAGRNDISVVSSDLIDVSFMVRLLYSTSQTMPYPSLTLMSTGSTWAILNKQGSFQRGNPNELMGYPVIWIDANDTNGDGLQDVVATTQTIENNNIRVNKVDALGSCYHKKIGP